MVDLFVFSLDIPELFNILYEIITMLQEEILNLIYLYWSHKDIKEENKSINGNSNESWINGYKIVMSPVNWNLLGLI